MSHRYHNNTNLRARKAEDTLAFTWGQKLSTSGSRTLCTRNGCQVLVAPSYRGGGGVGVRYFLKQELQLQLYQLDQYHTDRNSLSQDRKFISSLFVFSFCFSLALWPALFFWVFFKPSHDICIAHAFLLNANQLFSLCVCSLASTGGSGQGSCSKVRLSPALLQ